MIEKYPWRKLRDKTIIAVPNGEWGSSIKRMLTAANISWEQSSERSYAIDLPRQNVSLVITRAKDVPQLVKSESSAAVAGITGNDILIEKGMQQLDDAKTVGWQVPIKELDPQAPQPTVYLASTPNDYNDTQFGYQNIETVATGVTVTSYPRLARQYFDSKGYPEIDIEEFAGSIEGLWRPLLYCTGVIDISATGTTAEANGLTILETILEVQLLLIENSNKMNDLEERRTNDFKDALTEGARSRRFKRIFGTKNTKWVMG